MDWIVADTIRCSLSLWTTPQSIFLCSGIFNACLTLRKENPYVLSTSVLDSISLDFWINEKAATRHHEWQECFLLLGFAMLCNGFEIQNHDSTHQPKTEVYFRRRSALSAGWQSILQSMRLFHFQSSNSLVGILEYHSGCTHVKKFGKTFSIPCGQTFYTSVFKIGRGNFIPHPIVHRKAGNIRRL